MTSIKTCANHYCGYLPDERDPQPLKIALAAIMAAWLAAYALGYAPHRSSMQTGLATEITAPAWSR